jgi:Ricin-type beta-trefoil lectin domain
MKSVVFVVALFIPMLASLTSCATARQVTSGNSNMCINVENHGYPVAGTPVRIKPCDPWQNQKWVFDKGLITGVGGFCLDVQGSQSAEGNAVIYVPCNGSLSQNWNVVNGTIVGVGGKCIDVGAAAPANWSPLIVATCTGSPTQQWVQH